VKAATPEPGSDGRDYPPQSPAHRAWGWQSVHFFIELVRVFPMTIFLRPGETGVAHDPQQPGAHIPATKSVEETIRS
jgi:hypothetical protein